MIRFKLFSYYVFLFEILIIVISGNYKLYPTEI